MQWPRDGGFTLDRVPAGIRSFDVQFDLVSENGAGFRYRTLDDVGPRAPGR